MKKYQEAAKADNDDGPKEVIHFQYQRMMRYGGKWHLERKSLLPGYIFLSGAEAGVSAERIHTEEKGISLKPCEEAPYPRLLCSEGNLIEMSGGIIKNGVLTVSSGPLRGKEHLIKKIDRHKRTAEIEILLEGRKQCITVGLEVYEKQGIRKI